MEGGEGGDPAPCGRCHLYAGRSCRSAGPEHPARERGPGNPCPGRGIWGTRLQPQPRGLLPSAWGSGGRPAVPWSLVEAVPASMQHGKAQPSARPELSLAFSSPPRSNPKDFLSLSTASGHTTLMGWAQALPVWVQQHRGFVCSFSIPFLAAAGH